VDLTLSEEQRLIVDTVRAFVEKELYPHEDEVERLDQVPPELAAQIRAKAIDAGLYAANMPADLGGGGLDAVSLVLAERELGRASYALQMLVERPSNILRGCVGEQRQRYLLPAIRGERHDCVAMTEPGSGSDVRSMSTTARRDGDDYVVNGTKHFISHADVADFVILFAATGGLDGPRKQITAFLVDKDSPGLTVTRGPDCVSNRGYHQCEVLFTDCRVPARNLLGEEGRGFDLMGQWLGATRLTVAATSVGRARRVLAAVTEWAATRRQFGQPVGRFQGVGFQLADCATQLEAAELLMLRASEMLARMTDTAVQIFGGMGLMSGFPAERWWRDARVERIWDGTSEIQRHIIARSLLRPYGALCRLRLAPTDRSWSSPWTGRRPTRSTSRPAAPCIVPLTGCGPSPGSASRS
jgi:acyl-CoA dehydrogenase